MDRLLIMKFFSTSYNLIITQRLTLNVTYYLKFIYRQIKYLNKSVTKNAIEKKTNYNSFQN